MKFFLPKQPIFFESFQRLSSYTIEIAAIFEESIKNFDRHQEYVQKAIDIEHAADTVAHDIIDALNKTFVTPLDREDIFLLAKEVDEVVDLIENVIQNFVLYNITEEHPALEEFSALITEAAKKLDEVVGHLENAGKDASFKKNIVAIHEIEDRGDAVFKNAIQILFAQEKDPIAIIKWKDIFENLEHVLDTFQDVSDTIEGIVVKLD